MSVSAQTIVPPVASIKIFLDVVVSVIDQKSLGVELQNCDEYGDFSKVLGYFLSVSLCRAVFFNVLSLMSTNTEDYFYPYIT